MAEFTVTGQTLTARTGICKLAGHLDALAFETLEDEFGKILESGVMGIMLEVSGLENLTSAGVGAILNLDRMLKQRQGVLVLSGVGQENMGLLHMLGLTETLTMAATSDEARKLIAALN